MELRGRGRDLRVFVPASQFLFVFRSHREETVMVFRSEEEFNYLELYNGIETIVLGVLKAYQDGNDAIAVLSRQAAENILVTVGIENPFEDK
jgi:hypothetical protein